MRLSVADPGFGREGGGWGGGGGHNESTLKCIAIGEAES